VLKPAEQWSVLLHGSMTRGLGDHLADIDLWCLGPATQVAEIDLVSPTRFFPFEHRGRLGHLNVESTDRFIERVSACDLALIAELRLSRVLADTSGVGVDLRNRALRTMPEDVRRAWFRHHYVEYRGAHRGVDNPAARGHSVAVFLASAECLAHALRAAMVLDGMPYSYDKWLYPDALTTSTGTAVAASAERFLDEIAQGSLRTAAPEASHPIVQTLKEPRAILVDRARATGLDGEYLDRWWLHMDAARRGISEVRWPS